MQSVCLYQSVVFLPTGVQWPSAWSHGVPPAAGENYGHPSVSTPALPKAAGLLLLCLPWGRSQPIWAQFGVSGYHSTVTLGWINFAITVLFGRVNSHVTALSYLCDCMSSALHTFPYSLLCFWYSQPPDSSHQTLHCCPMPVLFSVYLHGMTFRFLSDRNPLWSHLNVT